MLKRDFIKYDEAVHLLGGDAETFRQALLHGKINAYVELTEVNATYYAQDDEEVPQSGRSKFAKWLKPFRSRKNGAPDSDDDNEIPYTLTGWFVLERFDVERAARGLVPDNFGWGTTIGPATDSGGEPYHLQGGLCFDVARFFGLHDLWFRFSDIQRLEDRGATPISKPLDSRERTTLLKIIRALDVMANLPTRGATGAVEKQLQVLGFTGPKDATIRSVLDEARKLERDK